MSKYHVVADRLSFIYKKAKVCIKHDQSIQPSDMHTLDIHHVAMISDTQSILGVLFRLALKFGEHNE